MKRQLEAVAKFHTSFELDISNKMIADLDIKKNELRYNLMKEENEEYLEVVQNNDLTETARANASKKSVKSHLNRV